MACGIPHRLCVNWLHPRLPDGAAREEGPGDPVQTPARMPQRSAVRHVVGSMSQVRGQGLDRSRVSLPAPWCAHLPARCFCSSCCGGWGFFLLTVFCSKEELLSFFLLRLPVMCLMSLTPCLLSCPCATSQSHHTCSLPKGEVGIVPTGGPPSGKNHGKGRRIVVQWVTCSPGRPLGSLSSAPSFLS